MHNAKNAITPRARVGDVSSLTTTRSKLPRSRRGGGKHSHHHGTKVMLDFKKKSMDWPGAIS